MICVAICGVFFGILLVSVWYPFWYPVIPELCVTQEWGSWTPCSKSCGSSVKKRSRAIKIPKAGKLGNQKNNFKKKGQRALSFFFDQKKSFECAKTCKNYMRHSENLEYCCHLVKQAWFVSSTLRLNSIYQLCLDKNLAESTMYWGQGYPRRSRCQANGGKDCVGVADDERPVAMKVYLCTLRGGKTTVDFTKVRSTSGHRIGDWLEFHPTLTLYSFNIMIYHVLIIRKKHNCSDVLSVAFYSKTADPPWSQLNLCWDLLRNLPKTAVSQRLRCHGMDGLVTMQALLLG